MDHFTYRVTWSKEDDEHVGLCAEFPSLSWLAPTPEAALAGIRKTVFGVVTDLKRNGEDVPCLSPNGLTVVISRCVSRRKFIALWHCRRQKRGLV